MGTDADRRRTVRVPDEGSRGAGRRLWSPPHVSILPLDMTGGGGGAPGNEHTPHSYMDPVRGMPPPPPES